MSRRLSPEVKLLERRPPRPFGDQLSLDELLSYHPCPHCHGSGRFGDHACRACEGLGRVGYDPADVSEFGF